ncbi:unnamed protein product [Mesocestoides corti]|uniref:U3 small nucleolar RNA-associated protein 6 homolog n=3 Tax=Mesocestoides corti TaxID=53468 RepID=A0A0R3U9N1_MESCO|nr:unnamed protein product [Mesocestoides corti]
MAEVVERNIEDSLSEYSYIRRAKLFNEEEIREIVRRRRQHEYSLQKRNKRISDYESYIATELGILRLISLRRLKTMDFRFKDKLEKSVISRLVRLHKQICYRFQSRVDVWMRFLLFNRKLGRHLTVARLWERVLQVHGRTDPRLWSAAAAFHLTDGARAKALSALNKLRTEKQALKKSRKKLAQLMKNPTCSQEKAVLRLETLQLTKLRDAISRQVRLTWDRTLISGLREARRILVQGLRLNEDSVFLVVELLKLEASATDFFQKRVLSRQKQAASVDADDRTDAETFMAEVSEDVDVVASGGTFNLVLERFLTLPKCTSVDIASVIKIATKFSFANKALVDQLSDRQKQLEAEEIAEKENIEKAISETMCDKAATIASTNALLEGRLNDLQHLLEAEGVDAALSAWTTWYPTGVRCELLQVLDPSSNPRWLALLTFRLQLVNVSKMQKPEFNGDVEEAVRAYNEYRLKHEERVKEARKLMDTLAVSNWGSKVGDFWRLYMEFERKLGDCSRLPSLKWRAEKTLRDAPRAKFLADCTDANAKEFL